MRQTPVSALLARIVTGPLAFAVGGVLDWLQYAWGVLARRFAR